MEFIEKLLDGVEVEYCKVGELISPQRGKRLVKSQLEDAGRYAVYQNSMKPLGYYHEANTQAGTTFVIVAGAAGEIGFSDVSIWAADDVYFFPESTVVSNKYLYHFLLTKQHEISSQVRRASVPRLSMAAIEKLEVPIPCPDNPKKSLEIQAEIVRILDAFTAMTAELTAELNLRQQQYNHYRDQLLSFEEGEVEWKTLGSLATITIGEFVHKDKQDDSAQYPVYNGGRTATGYYENYNNTGNKIIVSARGANAGFVNRVSTPYWAGNSCYSIGIKDSSVLNWDFVYYFLKLSEFKLIGSQQKGGIPAVSKKQMESFLVPVPELAHQGRIVAVLDKFDALTNSITEGLPREIELRQKQYEYYRDLLLSFPKSEAA